jgi:hypothetical protein
MTKYIHSIICKTLYYYTIYYILLYYILYTTILYIYKLNLEIKTKISNKILKTFP